VGNRKDTNCNVKEKEFVLKTKKVLIAEHDPGHAELIIEVLNMVDTKKEIILKKAGQEVIDYFQEADIDSSVRMKLQIDLIILDVNLPKVDGMDVLRYLKSGSMVRSIPIIIFSNTTDTKTISEVYENGANSFITKPTSFNEFKENIKTLKKYLLN
jgi:DNA-binding response OmpR family regulator